MSDKLQFVVDLEIQVVEWITDVIDKLKFVGLKSLILLIALSASVLLSPACKRKAETNETPVLSQPPQTNYPMPPAKTDPGIGWTIANEQHVNLSDYKDKIVILDFYATWCEPCRESVPHLVDLQKRYGEKGLRIVGLNVGGPDDYAEVPGFAREFKIQYQLGIPDAELESLYMSDDRSIPQTIIIDGNGVVLKRFIGYDETLAYEIERAIRSSLAAAQ
jgi:cytochrome c biogenesis protein CcmG/thiol:disulfide interchange protein DsbE